MKSLTFLLLLSLFLGQHIHDQLIGIGALCLADIADFERTALVNQDFMLVISYKLFIPCDGPAY